MRRFFFMYQPVVNRTIAAAAITIKIRLQFIGLAGGSGLFSVTGLVADGSGVSSSDGLVLGGTGVFSNALTVKTVVNPAISAVYSPAVTGVREKVTFVSACPPSFTF